MRKSLTILLLLTACGASDGQWPPHDGRDQDQADNRILVEVATVSTSSVAQHLQTTGTLDSDIQADIFPQANGTVTQILVEEGDLVMEGDVLAIIANPNLDGGADRAQIELERAQREMTKAEQLHSDGAISDQELQQARTALQTATATAQEAIRAQGFTRLTTPITGTIAVRDIRVGDLAGAARAFQVVDLNRLRVIIQLPERDLPQIAVGQPAQLHSAYDEAVSVDGSIARISPVVDPNTGTIRVTISISEGQTALRPGQFVKVDLEVDRHNDVIAIPQRALVWEDGEAIAWVVTDAPSEDEDNEDTNDQDGDDDAQNDDSPSLWDRMFNSDEDSDEADDASNEVVIPQRIAQRRTLEIGFSDFESVEVHSGVTPGEQVIVVGNNNLRADARVRLPEDPAPQIDTPDDEQDDENEDASIDEDAE